MGATGTGAPPAGRLTVPAILIALIGVLLSAGLSGFYFDFSPFEADTASNLFQARLFAQGKLAADAPPDFGFSPSPHINIHDGRWYSKYPFGNALALAPGVLVGAPWLIPALATGASLLFLFLLIRAVHGPRVGLLAALLGLVSPMTLGIGATMFSEPVSRFFLALYLWTLFRALRGGTLLHAVIAGFALGFAFNTRPMTAIAFGVAGAAWALHEVVRSPERKTRLRTMMAFLAAFGVLLAAWLAWNDHFTGDPLQSTHSVLQPQDRIGFGNRFEGYETMGGHARKFTPGEALKRSFWHTLPCISYNALGWGRYRPSAPDTGQEKYTESIVAGIVVRSSHDGNWVALKLLGDRVGNGRAAFQVRGEEVNPSQPGQLPGAIWAGGRADVHMRLTRHGDQYTAYYRISSTQQWSAVGPVAARLTPPLQVGLFTGVQVPAGRMQVDFDHFRVNVDSSKTLVSDEFNDARETPGPRWRWQGKPLRWTSVDGRFLRIHAGLNQDLSDVEDSVATLFQTTSARNFQVQTRLIADWRDRSWHLRLPDPWVIPLLFPLVLMVLPLLHRSRSRLDVVLLATTPLCLGLYFFYHYDGTVMGFTPVNVRYYTECILLGIVPLVARGMAILLGWMHGRLGRAAAPLAGVLAMALTVNTVATHVANTGPYQSWNDVYQRLPKLVEEAGIHHAVVFIPGRPNAPLGDYPFAPLKSADLVYYRLGPHPLWRLNNSDWRGVYKQYFQGRKAYIYQHGGLEQLSPP